MGTMGRVVCLAGFGTLPFTPAPRAQTFQFEPATYEVAEATGFVDVVVTISGPPEFSVGVVYETFPGSALEGPDFTHTEGFLSWSPGQTVPRVIRVPIQHDDLTEGPETFTVELTNTDGGAIGTPSVATVTIVEGSGDELRAYLDIGDAFESTTGQINFFGRQGSGVEVRVLLNRMPTEPVTVPWTSEYPPFSGTLEFDGVMERSFVLSPPVSGLTVTRGNVSIGNPTGRGSWLVAFLNAVFDGVVEDWLCVYCFVDCVLCELGIGECECAIDPFCGDLGSHDPRDAGGTGLDILQQYRDQVLATTPEGQYYTGLYEELSGEIGLALLSEPTFLYRVVAAKDEWIAAIGALVDGQGATAVVTPSMQASLNAILDELAENGSPNLASKIELERTRLHLDALTGMTMDEFQEQVETLGGTPTERTSWGELKGRYR
jgi:hypothetical protein